MGHDPVLDAVGPRLRSIRQRRGATLAELSETTGISVSTLSRLESGGRRPTLVRARPVQRNGRTLIPLSQRPGGIRAYKMLAPASEAAGEQKSHEGYEWMYVLSGQLRLRLADHDFVMKPGEAAEFDTRVPHWFGAAGAEPAELLILFGPQGERMHVRARPRERGPERP
jgi:transcriptional regulator with XRE-family HTH domain